MCLKLNNYYFKLGMRDKDSVKFGIGLTCLPTPEITCKLVEGDDKVVEIYNKSIEWQYGPSHKIGKFPIS